MSDSTSFPPPPEDPSRQVPPPPPAYGSAPPPAPNYGIPAPMVPVAAPASIKQAVLLMKVGAGISLVSLLSIFIFRSEMRTAAEEAVAKSGGTLKASDVDALVNLGMAIGVISGLIGAGLWLWMAVANGKGKNWARIVATILFAIHTLSFVANFSQPTALLSRVLGIVMWLVAAYIIVLLYKKESSQFYAANAAPKY